MEITITINGKPVQATVDDAVICEAIGEKKSEKMTGYERKIGADYYYAKNRGGFECEQDIFVEVDSERYENANYYVSEDVAENNVRADTLMRNLRRFAAEHGGCLCPKSRKIGTEAYVIRYDGILMASIVAVFWPTTWGVLFATKESCEEAIKVFRDELTWYFTEYDPMPEGWWDS